ncbi:MAG TPA: adenine phosphoribosyltransferase [Gammaproteobacteria bacterium]|jgi:adenine phosphoribosyltransferase|nr:adenine phosphoribosyltransferase [Gammaproteobacteria bacterium]
MTNAMLEQIQALIRDVPDFPRPGILFHDITPLLADAKAFACAIDLLAECIARHRSEGIVAIESRGFIFGAALALKTHLPLQLIRKQGKLPSKSIGISYQLEYGSDRIEMHADAIMPDRAYALVDDLIATGGTAAAAADLIELQGGEVDCCVFLIELAFLHGRKRLGNRQIESLIQY